MNTSVPWSDLAFFYIIVVIPLVILWMMDLKDLSKDLAISIVRMSVQLLVIGSICKLCSISTIWPSTCSGWWL